ncbi:MAG TPA: acyltransferase [Ferrovibrio sp.]|uniref:acyltransferase family protein n=1 Tax=Ferrovibrio sp. TaxID=1917215 RepID=UPI002ED0E36C
MRRLQHLDGLRGWAALFVLFHHVARAFLPAGNSAAGQDPILAPFTFLTDGPLAVSIFFILSGIVLAAAVDAARAGAVPPSLPGLIVKRWLRLGLPILAAGLLVPLLFAFGANQAGAVAGVTHSAFLRDFFPAGYQPSVPQVIREAAVGAFVGPDTPEHDPILWTIRIEFPGSILVFALKLFTPRGRPTVMAALIAAVALTLLPFWMAHFCALFALGVAMREIAAHEKRSEWFAEWHDVAGFAMILLGLSIYPLLDAEAHGLMRRLGGLVDPIGHMSQFTIRSVLVVGGVMLSPTIQRFLSNAVSTFLGRISFGLYLLHAPLLWSLGGLTYLQLYWRLGQKPAALLAGAAVAVAACIAAKLFHHAVEKPAMKLASQAVMRRGVVLRRG